MNEQMYCSDVPNKVARKCVCVCVVRQQGQMQGKENLFKKIKPKFKQQF